MSAAAVDNSGQIVAAGTRGDATTYDSTTDAYSITGNLGAFVAKVGSDGTLRWMRQIAGSGDELGEGMAIVPSGEIDADYTIGSGTLNITAGQGSSVGHRLEHLAHILEHVRRPQRVGVCLDTAHLFAAGYDFRGRKYGPFMKQVERLIGRQRVKVLHINDSKKPLGSRVDRHQHIGHGHIGRDGFRALLRDPCFANIPKILETPKEKAPDGRDWDEVNLQILREIAR